MLQLFAGGAQKAASPARLPNLVACAELIRPQDHREERGQNGPHVFFFSRGSGWTFLHRKNVSNVHNFLKCYIKILSNSR